jgi:3-polyprenyl-4-hydroxybenzoate decarboxylase
MLKLGAPIAPPVPSLRAKSVEDMVDHPLGRQL